MAARILTAMSTALIIVLSLTITAKVVEPAHRAKALGVIYMGISSSLVLGVPLGILISEAFGWRVLFLGIGILSIGSMILIYMFLDRIKPEISHRYPFSSRRSANRKSLERISPPCSCLQGTTPFMHTSRRFLNRSLG